MEQQGKPQIPSLKDSQKPQVKIKGLQAGLSLFDRLKQFKKKDLAFITAGLGVLFMAPLAEHFMMAPESGQMKEGWDIKPTNTFGSGSSPFDRGVDGMAPGGPAGGGGDVITPLNVRDPSALVMGPGSSQQPPATSTTPPPPPPSKSEGNDWKDAIANAAATGAKEAVKKASLPVPKPSLTNAGLRGLGAVSGGGGGSYSAPTSQGLASNRAAGSNSLQRVQSAPGFKGAAGARGMNNASAGSMEALKKAANGAVDTMNRGGPASSAAEQAAAMAMGSGSGGGDRGAGGDGAADKGAAGSQNKDSSSVGESLEFLRRKAEQDKAIDLKWKLKEKQAMMWPNLKEKIVEELAMAPIKGIAGGITESIKSWGSDKSKAAAWTCDGGVTIPASKVASSCAATAESKDSAGKSACISDLSFPGSIKSICPGTTQCKAADAYKNCVQKNGDAADEPKTEDGAVSGIQPTEGGSGYTGESLEKLCKEFESATDKTGKTLVALAKRTVQVRDAVWKGPTTECKAESLFAAKNKKGSVLELHLKSKELLAGDKDSVAFFMYTSAERSGVTALDALSEWDVMDKSIQKTFAPETYVDGGPQEALKGGTDKVPQSVAATLQAAQDANKAMAPEKIEQCAGPKCSEWSDEAAEEGAEPKQPLPEAKARLAFVEELLTKIEKNEPYGESNETVGLPTKEELDALKKDVKALMDLGNKDAQKYYENLQAIVTEQGRILGVAREVQGNLYKRMERAEVIRPSFNTLVKNAGEVLSGKPPVLLEAAAPLATKASGKSTSFVDLGMKRTESSIIEKPLPKQVIVRKVPPETKERVKEREDAERALGVALGAYKEEAEKLKDSLGYVKAQSETVVTGANTFKTETKAVVISYGK